MDTQLNTLTEIKNSSEDIEPVLLTREDIVAMHQGNSN